MPGTMKYLHSAVVGLFLLFNTTPAPAQDLDPRAYARFPVDLNYAVAGFSYSHRGVVTDATSVLQNGHAKVETPSLGVGHSFSLFG